jgi:hypothetical protein
MGRYVVCILRGRIVIGVCKLCSACERNIIDVSEVCLVCDMLGMCKLRSVLSDMCKAV